MVILTGPKPKEIQVETFRIDYLIRTPKVEKMSLQPIRIGLGVDDFGFGVLKLVLLSHDEELIISPRRYHLKHSAIRHE